MKIHENLSRVVHVVGSSNRSFGIVFSLFFLIIGLLPLFYGDGMRLWAFVSSGTFLVIAVFCPFILAPLNHLWILFGLLLNRLVSPLILGFLFYFVVTPVGMIMRISGKDPLRLRFDPHANTYWIKRSPPGPPPDSLNNQF